MHTRKTFGIVLAISLATASSSFGQTLEAPTSIADEMFKLQLEKSISALGKIQAIYGEKSGGQLNSAQIREIQRILKENQSNTLAIYNDKVIYGGDNRKNYFEADANEKKASEAVSLVVNTSDLLETGAGDKFNLPGSSVGLCSTEKFHSEPAPGFCTGFKVGADLVATAGHCIRSQAQCARTSFVFKFRMDSNGDNPHKGILRDDVYACKEVVDGELNGPDQSDWRVVRVNRALDVSIPTVKVRKSGMLDTGDPITIVGHPMGLPLKVTPGGVVRSHKSSYFVANPDTYGGNSGSPAFNSTKLSAGELFVEGILVRGEDDFSQYTPCMKSKICQEEGCRGEDVTYSSEFAGVLPN